MTRLAIVILVPVLVLSFLASWDYGTQGCATCGVEREAYGLGPLWIHMPISAKDRDPWSDRGIPICDAHDWKRVGCWQLDGATVCYFGGYPRD